MSRVIISLAGRKRTGKETVYKLMLPYLQRPEEFQFATPLKKFCIEVLGLTHEQCYGSSADRETPTKYKWEWVDQDIREEYGHPADKIMTAREVLQVVGTDLMRKQFYENIWAEAGVRAAVQSSAKSCVITDTRFPNEIEVTKDKSLTGPDFGKSITIRLYRDTGLQDAHHSETALDIYDARPNQRRILTEDIDGFLSGAYERVTDSLWVSTYKSNVFDYLVDNNGDLDSLRENVKYILMNEYIFNQPTLS